MTIFLRPYKLFILTLSLFVFLLLGVYLSSGNATVSAVAPAETFLPVADTYIASGQPNRNWAEDPRLWVGYSQSPNNKIERSLLKFDLASVPQGSRIDSAILSLKLEVITPNDPDMAVKVSRLLGDFNENVSWDGAQSISIDPSQAATTQVGTDFRRYTWDIKQITQDWSDRRDTPALGVILQGNEAAGQHERAFWSSECTGCSGEVPRLEIQFTLPTPTPTNTATSKPKPTNTPTATPTPTPAPGIKSFQLQNSPTGEIAANGKLTYTIAFQNGPFAISQVAITNTIPANAKFVPNSLKSSILAVTMTVENGVAHWNFDNDLAANFSGTVSYMVTPKSGGTGTTPSSAQIVNEGANISWRYKNQPRGRLRSNKTFNPQPKIYMPMISKNPGAPTQADQ